MRKIIKNILKVLIVIAIIVPIAFFAYTSDYYQMSPEVTNYLLDEDVKISYIGDTMIFEGDSSEYGLIFYPGAKVDYKAYVPLMNKLAKKGILCVLVKMPGNIALLDVDAADGYIEQFPSVEHWYMGGHSLGGASATKYVAKHVKEYEGLILLGSYPMVDLKDSGLNIIMIHGEHDSVMNMEHFEGSKQYLPTDYYDYVIGGGIHSYFGMYGIQEGDGEPTISNEQQMDITADYIVGRLLK